MKELIEYIARKLVSRPASVHVSEFEQGEEVQFELRLDADDVGAVIGRQGRTVGAIRDLLVATADLQGKVVRLEVIG